MPGAHCFVGALGLIVALPACAADAEDGIFAPGFASPANDDADPTTTDDGGASEDSSSDGADESSGSGAATSASLDEGSSDGIGVDTCPDALLDTGYVCPLGSTFSTGDGYARCMFEQIPVPSAASLLPYCQYLDQGYLGFSWSLAEVPAHACPAEARYAPTDTTGYCLWEDVPLPGADVTADCNALVVGGGFGFRWTCPG